MESPDAQETQAETGAPEGAPEAPAPEGAPEGAPEAPAPETPAQEASAEGAAFAESAAQSAVPEEVLPDTPAPKARAKGRPKGSKTVNRRAKATADPEAAEFAAAPRAVVETPPDIGGAASRSDIFEIIRQRQTAQFERRQAFYQSFLPVR